MQSLPEYDEDLEVEMELLYELEVDDVLPADAYVLAQTAAKIRRDASPLRMDESLDDEWFGSFDDTKPIDFIDDEPTTPWRRFSTWVRSLKRAA